MSTATADAVALESPPSHIISRKHLFRFLAALIILVTAALRIAYLTWPGALDLIGDESHYWDWSRHPDWSYYSKGPLVAYLIGASYHLTHSWIGDSSLTVRLPAICCGALLLCSLYVLTTLVYRREGLALGVVAVTAVMPPIAAASLLMTIDAPYICCWSWALVFGHLALFKRGADAKSQAAWAWPAAGLMIALGLLAKQTMVLWPPSLMLFLFFTPGWRVHFRRPGLWVMLAIGSLGAVPILVWNSQHEWVTIKHLLGHAGVRENAEPIHWLGPLKYIGMQFVALMGYWFVLWCVGMWLSRPWAKAPPPPSENSEEALPSRDQMSYLWWMSAPMFVFFLLFSFKNGGGELNWPVTAYLSGLVLAAGWLAQRLVDPQPMMRRVTRFGLATMVVLGLGLSLLMHDFSLAYPLLSKLSGPPTAHNTTPIRRFDPTCRLRGWRTLAVEVDRLRKELKEREGIDAEIAGDRWTTPGALGFYCQGHPTVYSLGPAFGDRHSQYDWWHPNPVDDGAEFRGRTFILVVESIEPLKDSFDHIDDLHMVMHYQRGQPLGRWMITVGRGFRGSVPRKADGNHY